MLKVLHIISAPAAGGAEIYVKDLVLNSKKHKINPAILFISRAEEIGRTKGFENEFLMELDVNEIDYFFLPKGSRRNPLKGLFKFKKIVKDVQPDIVHSHLLAGIVYNVIGNNYTPLVYTHHNSVISITPLLFKIVMLFADGFIGISESCLRFLNKFIPSTKPIKKIINAVDISRLNYTKEKPTSTIKILAVGSISNQKNYPLMVDAIFSAKKLTKQKFKLYIAGEGSKSIKKYLISSIKEKRLEDYIQLLGNRSDIPQLMANSDIFCMSSDWEGLPIALIESQLVGTPCVVTDVGGCSEVIDITKGGIVVPANNSCDLSLALKKMIDDEDFRNSLTTNLKANSWSFEIQTALKSHKDFYINVINTKFK